MSSWMFASRVEKRKRLKIQCGDHVKVGFSDCQSPPSLTTTCMIRPLRTASTGQVAKIIWKKNYLEALVHRSQENDANCAIFAEASGLLFPSRQPAAAKSWNWIRAFGKCQRPKHGPPQSHSHTSAKCSFCKRPQGLWVSYHLWEFTHLLPISGRFPPLAQLTCRKKSGSGTIPRPNSPKL